MKSIKWGAMARYLVASLIMVSALSLATTGCQPITGYDYGAAY